MATKRVIFGRHANAVRAEHPENDLGRILSDTGMRQAMDLVELLDPFNIGRVFSSPAVRTTQTAATATGYVVGSVERIPELYTPEGPDGLLLDEMFTLLGYQPARVYLSHELNNGCVERFSGDAGAAIADVLAQNKENETVAIFGHAVFTPLAVLSLVSESQMELRDTLLDMNMGEAEVFEVVLVDGIVTEVNFLDLDD